MILFSNNLFGTANHLAYDGGFRWVDDIPEHSFVFGKSHMYSIDEWLHISNESVPSLVEEKYLKMAEELNLQNPCWQKLLGNKFSDNLKKTTLDLSEVLKNSAREYEKTWRTCQKFMWSMQPAKINRIRYASLKAMNVSLPGFNSMTGSIDPVRYDRRTKTGRLRVSSGPSVLTLKTEHRNMLANCRQIDFKNMEPRLLLAFLGKEVEGDLYENIAKDLNLKGDRSYIKVSIISSLYGSRVVPEISKYFAMEEWIKQLAAEVSNDYLNNYFGRPIKVKNVTGHHLLSLWLQSSAADAALLAFSKFFNNHKNLNPHWIIHDACIFSGDGSIPEYLYVDENIRLPIECTEIK
jgi:hypothetical protein